MMDVYIAPDDDPVIVKNRVYFTHLSGRIFCIRAEDGKLIWKWKVPEKIKPIIGVRVVSPPVIVNDHIFFATKDTIYALKKD
jgi:outer membrane protein assembly factor BamB